MTTSAIRRQMKNIVNNYSEAEIKVREATSNDPWGPSSSLMTEIADLTYNVVAFSEIMSMIWKRLNDHGKNWRHVYKALTLLDYLIKTGSERVAQQCKENIFAIQTLKDFQYIDRDGKDQGINVREKSKQLVSLLKDDDRLKNERAQALKTKERMAQVATGVGSNNQITFGRGSSQPNLSTSYSEQEYCKSGGSPASYHGSTSPRVSSELEQARPQTSGEEELQLQLALAMSREVAEQEDRIRRGDDLRLQMALEESRRHTVKLPKKKETSLMDLRDSLPVAAATAAPQKSEAWRAPATADKKDPWGGPAPTTVTSDLWQSFGAKPAVSVDPWGSSAASNTQSLPKSMDPWTSVQTPAAAPKASVDPWASTPPASSAGSSSFDPFSTLNGTAKDDFSDFDSLRTSSKKPAAVPAPVNPFQVNQPQPLTLNQMRASPMMGTSPPAFNTMPSVSMEPMPLSSMAPPIAMGIAPVPAMGGMAPVVKMGQGMNMSLPQPLLSTGISPSAAQPTSATNPFLL
ncbi:epsin-2 isoform X2 [Latimeria chalumnae]|uniref:epsin-2 isoform X2 n=1 Tax=Latimeria chalumnae TaxID=7897 RepID=UPI0003C12678|nr:PREDICTED: epsin-2 isoform X2 [Latimeria chalumnae]|eukprot:XP_005997526.1 PREDICTED: epsin-2 isoform X2 [Latimeria chalumnae]